VGTGSCCESESPSGPDSFAADLTVALPTLPYGLALSSATAQRDGLHFAVTGRDVTVRQP
jgi:hypothetical protein